MPNAENQLISLLPRADRQRLVAICEPVQLVLSEVLCESGKPLRYVYFPVDGFISLLTVLDGKPTLEVGMVGREGMLGAQLALGVATTPLHALVQGVGSAWRVPTAKFRKELAQCPALHRILSRYLYVLMGQQASSAACLRYHYVEPRLARWLLMSQDRAHSSCFHITHEFLAHMLGVRRVGVTASAGALQKLGLIEYRRGEITVIDRSGLERAACSCYKTNLRSYQQVLV
ncbi:MAG: Crp/Fnr family transcriptional regulator [Bdellovibrionales bacterium]|nr:Crp/Fnr family transcriptional regulator [Ramlibacter sp.]